MDHRDELAGLDLVAKDVLQGVMAARMPEADEVLVDLRLRETTADREVPVLRRAFDDAVLRQSDHVVEERKVRHGGSEREIAEEEGTVSEGTEGTLR